jgi:hypothetical protein
MNTNNDSLIYLCVRPYKNPLTKQVSQESSVMIRQTCISVLHTNHAMLEKRSPRTHITYTSSVTDMFIIYKIADLFMNQNIDIYTSMSHIGTTQTVPFGVPESYNLYLVNRKMHSYLL